MKMKHVDIMIIGAGPVGLMCAYLAQLCQMTTCIVDKSSAPLKVGRADALNARSLQLLELINLFDDLYPHGKPCNTSSVWRDGRFISRQSAWWEHLPGCIHKHFLMLGQAHVEQLLDGKLKQSGCPVKRSTTVVDMALHDRGCLSTLSDGEQVHSHFVIGADGSRSFVRNHFNIPFEIVRPQITWAVIDGIIDSDFNKVPEIIVFQNETSDVAWIPREGNLDRFYVRMDCKEFTLDDACKKINQAMKPHRLRFKEVSWFSQFSVKESVAEKYIEQQRVFLAGDACHIHSVNGGQGLNTGLADAFNLIWKLHFVLNHNFSEVLLQSYEVERKKIAKEVIATSGELVRATKYSPSRSHAENYVKIIERRAGYITGMGVAYGQQGLKGTRLHDMHIYHDKNKSRLYSLLDYAKYSLIIFTDKMQAIDVPDHIQLIFITSQKCQHHWWTDSDQYVDLALLVRPDGYIQDHIPVGEVEVLLEKSVSSFFKPSLSP